MAEAGADVVCGDVDEAGLAETVRAVEALGRRAVAVRCDVTDEGRGRRPGRAAVGELGRIDVLFNNAGIADTDQWLLHEYPTDEWRRVLAIDLEGVFFCAREALKVMVGQGSGKVVNVASMWGLAGSSSLFPAPAYTAAKGAVVNLTRELGLQYATRGIQVNALCPGFYRTSLGPYDDPEFVASLEGFIPMGRIAAAEEIRGPGAVPRLARVGLHDGPDARHGRRLPGEVAASHTEGTFPNVRRRRTCRRRAKRSGRAI